MYYDERSNGIIDDTSRIYSNKGWNDEAADIVETETGYMIAGTSTSGSNSDIFFCSIAKDGTELIKPKQIGGAGIQVGTAIEATPDGGCIIIGTTGTSTQSKIIVYKLDANGNY
jgi:hypothetical protein